MDNVFFRASGIGALMTEAKGSITEKQLEKLNFLAKKEILTDKQKLELISLQEKSNKPFQFGETAKSFIFDTWAFNEHKIVKDIDNKYTKKGRATEEKCVSLLSHVDKTYYHTNTTRMYDNNITGICDVDTGSKIIDIKSSWDLFTFHNSKISKLYEWQGRCYMYLYDRSEFELVYCLVNAPEEIIQDEVRRECWKRNIMDTASDQYMEIEEIIRNNFDFESKFSPDQRIKRFTIRRDDEKFKELLDRKNKALEYYKTIKING